MPPEPLIPNAVVQTVIGAGATAFSAYRSAHEFSEWFQEGARFVKRLRPTTDLTDPIPQPSMSGYAKGPSTLSTRTKRVSARALNPRTKRAIQACCEGLLEEKVCASSRAFASVTAASAGGAVVCLNPLSQGTGVGGRVGSRTKNRWLILKGLVQLPATSTGDVYRLAVVLDHEAYGSAPTYTAVFSDPSVYSLPNYDTAQQGMGKRFTFLADKTIALNPQSTPGAGNGVIQVPFELRLQLKFDTQYTGNAGTVADIVKNSLILIEATNGGVAQSLWYSQVVYLDA